MLAVSAGLVAALPAAPAAARPAEVKMVKQINKIRHARGLPKLRPAYSLFVSAKVYSHRMMRSDYFGHRSRIPVASRWRFAGETLEMHRGWRLSPRRVVWSWMGSPSHRAVLLSRRFTRIGVGRTRGNYGRMPSTMWVAHLGRR
ncbi:MAG: hypothetical protein QOE69_2936 [Thermoleophilaceae bacterium]|nr:hypothetical protein [Thermoleophilaceae bacterium]